MNEKHIYRLKICCEELICELLDHCFTGSDPVNMNLNVAYSEAEKTVDINLSCGGRSYVPLFSRKTAWT